MNDAELLEQMRSQRKDIERVKQLEADSELLQVYKRALKLAAAEISPVVFLGDQTREKAIYFFQTSEHWLKEAAKEQK
jgi:hypothetical protein